MLIRRIGNLLLIQNSKLKIVFITLNPIPLIRAISLWLSLTQSSKTCLTEYERSVKVVMNNDQ